MYTDKELEAILQIVTKPYKESEIKNLKVYHGTIESAKDDVILGPKNKGNGYGGPGLYIALDSEKRLAYDYANYAVAAAYEQHATPILLSGYLTPKKSLRIASIRLAPRNDIHAYDLIRGIFPPDWSNDIELSNLMMKSFDIIEVLDAKKSGYNINSDRYWVIHESAGKDIINWVKTEELTVNNLNAESVLQSETLSYPGKKIINSLIGNFVSTSSADFDIKEIPKKLKFWAGTIFVEYHYNGFIFGDSQKAISKILQVLQKLEEINSQLSKAMLQFIKKEGKGQLLIFAIENANINKTSSVGDWGRLSSPVKVKVGGGFFTSSDIEKRYIARIATGHWSIEDLLKHLAHEVGGHHLLEIHNESVDPAMGKLGETFKSLAKELKSAVHKEILNQLNREDACRKEEAKMVRDILSIAQEYYNKEFINKFPTSYINISTGSLKKILHSAEFQLLKNNIPLVNTIKHELGEHIKNIFFEHIDNVFLSDSVLNAANIVSQLKNYIPLPTEKIEAFAENSLIKLEDHNVSIKEIFRNELTNYINALIDKVNKSAEIKWRCEISALWCENAIVQQDLLSKSLPCLSKIMQKAMAHIFPEGYYSSINSADLKKPLSPKQLSITYQEYNRYTYKPEALNNTSATIQAYDKISNKSNALYSIIVNSSNDNWHTPFQLIKNSKLNNKIYSAIYQEFLAYWKKDMSQIRVMSPEQNRIYNTIKQLGANRVYNEILTKIFFLLPKHMALDKSAQNLFPNTIHWYENILVRDHYKENIQLYFAHPKNFIDFSKMTNKFIKYEFSKISYLHHTSIAFYRKLAFDTRNSLIKYKFSVSNQVLIGTLKMKAPCFLENGKLGLVEISAKARFFYPKKNSLPKVINWLSKPTIITYYPNKAWTDYMQDIVIRGRRVWQAAKGPLLAATVGVEFYNEYQHAKIYYPCTPLCSAFLSGLTKGMANILFYSAVDLPGFFVFTLADITPDMMALYEKDSIGLDALIEDLREREASLLEWKESFDDYYMTHPFARPEIIFSACVQKLVNFLNLPKHISNFIQYTAENNSQYISATHEYDEIGQLIKANPFGPLSNELNSNKAEEFSSNFCSWPDDEKTDEIFFSNQPEEKKLNNKSVPNQCNDNILIYNIDDDTLIEDEVLENHQKFLPKKNTASETEKSSTDNFKEPARYLPPNNDQPEVHSTTGKNIGKFYLHLGFNPGLGLKLGLSYHNSSYQYNSNYNFYLDPIIVRRFFIGEVCWEDVMCLFGDKVAISIKYVGGIGNALRFRKKIVLASASGDTVSEYYNEKYQDDREEANKIINSLFQKLFGRTFYNNRKKFNKLYNNYIENHNYDKAITLIEGFYNKYGLDGKALNDAKANVLLLQAYDIIDNDANAAIEILIKARELSSNNSVLSALANAYIRVNNFGSAAEVFKQKADQTHMPAHTYYDKKSHSDFAQYHTNKANKCIAEGDLISAENELHQALDDDPKCAKVAALFFKVIKLYSEQIAECNKTGNKEKKRELIEYRSKLRRFLKNQYGKGKARNRKINDISQAELEFDVERVFHNVILADILPDIMKGDFLKAKSICEEYREAAPEIVDEYINAIEKLESTNGISNKNLLEIIKYFSNIDDQDEVEINKVILSILNAWQDRNIINLIYQGDFSGAKRELELLSQEDLKLTELYNDCISLLEDAEKNADNDEQYWISKYKELRKNKNDPVSNEQDDGAKDKDLKIEEFQLAIVIGARIKITNHLCKCARYREAVEVAERLHSDEPDLAGNEFVEDIKFLYQAQKWGIIVRPLQMALVRDIESWEPSNKRAFFLATAKAVNGLQIFIPNIVTFTAQAGYGICRGNRCVVVRNTRYILSQLWQDIKNPINKETYFRGTMIYGQAVLAFMQHISLERIASEKYLLTAEKMRFKLVSIGYKLVESYHIGVNIFMLRDALSLEWFSLFSATSALVSLTNTGACLGYWAYYKYKESRGEFIEDETHYACKRLIDMGILQFGTPALAFAATSAWPLTIFAWFAASAVNNYYIHGGHFEHSISVDILEASQKSISYHMHLQFLLQYIKNCRYILIQGDANENDIKKVKKRTAIIFANINNNYYIYHASDKKSKYIKKKLNKNLSFFRSLDWPLADDKRVFLDKYYGHYMMNSLGRPDPKSLEKGMYFYKNHGSETIQVLVVHDSVNTDSPDLRPYLENNESVNFECYKDEKMYRPINISAQLDKFIKLKCENMPSSISVIKKITKNKVISTPIIDEYTSVCKYRIQYGSPNKEIEQKIKQDKEICFTKESNYSFDSSIDTECYIYIKNKCKSVEKIAIKDKLRCFEILSNKNTVSYYYVIPGSALYEEVCDYTTKTIICHYSMNSQNKTSEHLKEIGFCYKENQSKENFMRIFHLTVKIQDYYRRLEYNNVIKYTDKFIYKNNTVINKDYKVPPHLAWEIIVFYRLYSYAASEALLLNFREQYEEYSKYIFESASHSKSRLWHCENRIKVQKKLKKVLKFALKNLVIAASKLENKPEKIKYLSQVTKKYSYVDLKWHETFKNDNFKLLSAYQFYCIGKQDECELLLLSIVDLSGIIICRKEAEYLAMAVNIFKNVDVDKRDDLLQKVAEDSTILNYVFAFLMKKKYNKAKQFIDDAGNFKYKQTALAMCTFESSGRLNILAALQQLLQEEDKTIFYWDLFLKILQECESAYNFIPKNKYPLKNLIKLYLCIKVCCDSLQSFSAISFEKNSIINIIENQAMRKIEVLIRTLFKNRISNEEVHSKMHEYIEIAHRDIIRPGFYSELKNILAGMSYDYIDGNEKIKYFPVDVPGDGDCAFHVLGVTRKESINLLLCHIKNRNIISTTLWGNTQRKDVIDIILNDLEIKNNMTYSREEMNFADNVKLVEEYVRSFLKQGEWMPYNQNAMSILDALALLLKKKLRIFVANNTGQLVLSSCNIHDNSFQTIDMLCTSTSGFSCNQQAFNHYIKLIKIPTRVIEIVEGSVKSDLHSQFFSSSINNNQSGFFNSVPSAVRRKDDRSANQIPNMSAV